MVDQHYRWDFIGLSTDTKPTPQTSPKVVNGSTYYCSDTSKLYVYCKNNWYERKALGGGGGGGSVTVVQTTGNSEDDVMSQKAVTDYLKSSYTLTDIDVNYDPDSTGTDTAISAWTLSSGIYHYNYGNSSLTADIYFGEEDGSPVVASDLGSDEAWFLVTNGENSGTSSIVLFINTSVITFYNDYSTGDIMQRDAFQTIDGAHLDATGILETAIRFSQGAPSQYTYADHIGSFFVDESTCNIYQCTAIDDTDPDDPTVTWTKLSKVSEVIISGTGAPTTATVGTVGLLYEDTTNGDLYQCTDATNPYVWEQVGAGGGGPTVVQTTGSSTTDVMSQNAVTSMIWADPTTKQCISIRDNGPDVSTAQTAIGIGISTIARGDSSVAIGSTATIYATGSYSTAIGNSAKTEGHSRSVALGNAANAAYDNSVAIGTNAVTTAAGQVNIGAGTSGRGFNNTNYRTISGVHDGQNNHDAATVAQGNTLSTSAPTTSTVGVLGQLWTDTTNMHTYQCTAISGSTYTWTQRW